MPTNAHNDWFEKVWAYREDVLYPSLFGKISRGIFPIQADTITGTFKQPSYDPRWLHCGVFEYGPNAKRSSWLYVTSGMSNNWNADRPDAKATSGLGCEYIFETTQRSEWAVMRLLDLMTFQILICHGRYPGREPISDFDRMPLRSSICVQPSMLTYLMLAPPSFFPREVQLESGLFNFYQVVGISEAEAAFARLHSGSALLELLISSDYFPVTDPARNEVSTDKT